MSSPFLLPGIRIPRLAQPAPEPEPEPPDSINLIPYPQVFPESVRRLMRINLGLRAAFPGGSGVLRSIGRGAGAALNAASGGFSGAPSTEPQPTPVITPAPTPIAPRLMLSGRSSPESAAFDENRLRADITGNMPAASSSQPPIPLREGPPEATPPAPRMRAIRMPGGKLLFTNRDEYGGMGDEISTEQAGKEVRAGDAMMNRTRPSLGTMTSLVRASARAALERGEGGDAVASTPPQLGPGVSMLEGTPEQKTRLKMEDAMGAAALGRAEQEAELASMPIGERAAMENKDIALGQWMMDTFGRNDRNAVTAGELASREVGNPRSPQFIADPKQRAAKLAEIEMQIAPARQRLQDLQTLIMRQRPGMF